MTHENTGRDTGGPDTRGRGVAVRRALTVAAAAGAALACWALADPVAGLDVTVRSGGTAGPVGPAMVAASSLLAGLLGWALLAVLERTVQRPRRVWTIVALIVLALSLAGPPGAAEGAGSLLVLIVLHLAVAAVLVPALPRRG
ncbi:DUF6069 family protein [Actinomadura algeriensis]|uniref:Uncharacterized protein n=1 Tax=Actinomadura algeriensis TaxID=1679523 RepID=A0ABR9JZS0_9ACTN|nr:DUF6069 family protein [Actinomadura algeriensis]MBE1536079.1 hypothetical protein [Actinomadura algeriensis]